VNDHDDDELRRGLGALDPASRLTPADPARVARLLEDAMRDRTPSQQGGDRRPSGTGPRGPLPWVAAAAAVVVVAGASFAATRGDDDVQAPTAGATTSQLPADTGTGDPAAEPGSTTSLVAPEALSAKCMMPHVQVLRTNTLAFDGTVTAIDGDQVTLEPTRWFKGAATETVTVTAPGRMLQELLVAVDFQVGGRYLVTAFEDTVTLCGFSAAYDEELAQLYQEAYTG
jgi:hypothetical protein